MKGALGILEDILVIITLVCEFVAAVCQQSEEAHTLAMILSCINSFVFAVSFFRECRSHGPFFNPNTRRLYGSFLDFLELVTGFLLLLSILLKILVGRYPRINVSWLAGGFKGTVKVAGIVSFGISFARVVDIMERVFSRMFEGRRSSRSKTKSLPQTESPRDGNGSEDDSEKQVGVGDVGHSHRQ